MDRQQRDGRNAGLGYSRRFEKSLISSGTLERERGEDSFTLQNLYFPFKLTATISALKIVEGCLLIGLGAAALGKTSNKKNRFMDISVREDTHKQSVFLVVRTLRV